MRFVLAFVFALLAGPAMAQSEEEVMEQIEMVQGDSVGFGEAFAALQDSFLFGDSAAFADLAEYPLEVAANGELYDILAPEDLVENFDALLLPETKEAIGGQDFADLIVSSDGVGFADGALWMANLCADDNCEETYWAIIRINN
jgi:hypothetical protein